MRRPDTFERSLWSAITPPLAVPMSPAQGEVRADVAIVGGGYLGLSTALHLAERGVSVVLLEARVIGHGASGRNTGFVVPALKGGLGLEPVSALIGADNAERLLRLVAEAGDTLFGLVQRVGISCDAEQNGWLQPAPTLADAGRIDGQVRETARLGRTLRALDAAETLRLTGVPGYHAALLVPSGGQLNPLAYARGLAVAATARGARLLTAEVAAIERDGGAWRLRTTGGATITADTAVLTTNALVGQLMPAVQRSLLPTRGYQVATQVLDPAVRARLLPQRQPLADLRNHPFALRWSPDNRLVTGGGAVINNPGSTPRMGRYFLERLARVVPDLPRLEAAYVWDGVIAGTGDFLPRLWSLGPGLYAPIGCNGRGVALTTTLGRAIANFLHSGDTAALPLPVTAPHPWRLHGLMRFAPSAWVARARVRDWRAARSATGALPTV